MNNCVFFASYIPNDTKLQNGVDILEKLIEYGFSDCDVIVGINPSSSQDKWIEILNNYKENFNGLYYDVTPPHLVVNSDASSYQTALRLYKTLNFEHDICWFIHTKGVVSNSLFINEIYKVFLSKKQDIENIFIEDRGVGLFSPYMYKIEGKKWENYIENNLKHLLVGENYYKCDNLSCYYTFYTIKGLVIKRFINEVQPIFFNERITDLGIEQKYDRYFFERDFPMITQKYGYKPYSIDFNWVEKYR